MRILSFASVFGLLSSHSAVPPSADTYFSTELPVAKAGLLANIGPTGLKASGAEVCCFLMAIQTRTHLTRWLSVWNRDC